jgi:hypothetical protein
MSKTTKTSYRVNSDGVITHEGTGCVIHTTCNQDIIYGTDEEEVIFDNVDGKKLDKMPHFNKISDLTITNFTWYPGMTPLIKKVNIFDQDIVEISGKVRYPQENAIYVFDLLCAVAQIINSIKIKEIHYKPSQKDYQSSNIEGVLSGKSMNLVIDINLLTEKVREKFGADLEIKAVFVY